ncbi:hypothetical protein R83H12_00571 [Fibrobacteria bacterium R8-3-H12]
MITIFYIAPILADLIGQEQYFVIHAARQSGKTTLLKELVRKINAEGSYHAWYCSLEAVQGLIEPEKGVPAVVKCILCHSSLHEKSVSDGLVQLSAYMDRVGASEGWLVVFDRSKDVFVPFFVPFPPKKSIFTYTMLFTSELKPYPSGSGCYRV